MKKNEIRSQIAANVEGMEWLANLPTTIRDLKHLQKSIKTEFKESAVERCRQQLKHAANSEKGGAASVQVRRNALALRNGNIASEGRRLMEPPSNHSPQEICAILQKNAISQGLSTKQIRTILQDEGVLEKRRK